MRKENNKQQLSVHSFERRELKNLQKNKLKKSNLKQPLLLDRFSFIPTTL